MASLVTQPADKGALPTLRAATDPDARGGQYYGPDGIGEINGPPESRCLQRTIARRGHAATAVDACPRS